MQGRIKAEKLDLMILVFRPPGNAALKTVLIAGWKSQHVSKDTEYIIYLITVLSEKTSHSVY